jgi:hypothetical protein
MLAKNFVFTRNRLLEICAEIRALAEHTSVSYDEQAEFVTCREIVNKPFLLTVCGAINAGKSSLINALHGRIICRVSDFPETKLPHLHTAGSVRREVSHGDTWLECQWPDETLNHVHWLDLPGIDAAGSSAFTRWGSWLERSDLVLVVFPYRNPWSSPTWDFLAKLSLQTQRSLVLVVQSCDEAEPSDLPVLLNHMGDLAQKRIGHQPPVFLVSARRFLEAKPSRLVTDQADVLGMRDLASFIDQRLDQCQERWRALETLRRVSLALLYQIDEKVDGMNRAVMRDIRFLEGLEREMDDLLQRTIHQQSMGLGAIAEEYDKQAMAMSQLLRSRLGLFPSLWRMMAGENIAQGLEALMQRSLTGAVKSATDRNAESLICDCEVHWALIGERLDDLGAGYSMPWSDIEPRLRREKQQLVERMDQAAVRSVGQLRVRGLLFDALRQRHAGFAMWMAMILVSLIVAGLAGGMYVPWIPIIASAVAGCFAVGLVMLSVRTARDMVDDYRGSLQRGADPFLSSLRGDYEEGLRGFFREYAHSLQRIRQALARRENALQPYSQRWNELFLKIKATEQDMPF